MQVSEHKIAFQKTPEGNTSVRLSVNDECVSWLTIVPFVIRIGSAAVRMDGVAGVGTSEKHRRQGYSRRVIEAAIDYMAEGDAAITMLYGIRDFYPKFGYATVGPDHFVSLINLYARTEMPVGWSVRPFIAADLPAVRDIYNRAISQAIGSVVRPDNGKTWSLLMGAAGSEDNDCRVVLGPDGEIQGYAWLAKRSHSVRNLLSKYFTDAFIVGEPVADSPASADALLAACRLWAQEVSAEQDIEHILLPVTPDTPVAVAAMLQDARIFSDYQSCGGSMARVLDVKRLLEAIKPEIAARLNESISTFTGRLIIRTDIGDAALVIEPESVSVENAPETDTGMVIEMPQTALVRFALGAFPPDDILARLPEPPDKAISKLIQTIFPFRRPQMFPADRF